MFSRRSTLLTDYRHRPSRISLLAAKSGKVRHGTYVAACLLNYLTVAS